MMVWGKKEEQRRRKEEDRSSRGAEGCEIASSVPKQPAWGRSLTIFSSVHVPGLAMTRQSLIFWTVLSDVRGFGGLGSWRQLPIALAALAPAEGAALGAAGANGLATPLLPVSSNKQRVRVRPDNTA